MLCVKKNATTGALIFKNLLSTICFDKIIPIIGNTKKVTKNM
jgi:hypothetical protein